MGTKRTRRNLTLEERMAIEADLRAEGGTCSAARGIGRPACTVSLEIKRNGGHAAYSAAAAQDRADAEAEKRRPPRKRPKLIPGTPEHEATIRLLLDGWSPEAISKAALDLDVGKDAVYAAIRRMPSGPSKDVLVGCLARQKVVRRPIRPKAERRAARLLGIRPIEERPAVVAERSRWGDWEADLIVGPKGVGRLGVLVERRSRFVVLAPVPSGEAAVVCAAYAAALLAAAPHPDLRLTLTCDRGSEMARHALITEKTGAEVFACAAYHPWEKGQVEGRNTLLRRFIPKDADPSRIAPDVIAKMAAAINAVPMKVLGWRTPAAVWAEACGSGHEPDPGSPSTTKTACAPAAAISTPCPDHEPISIRPSLSEIAAATHC